MTSLEMAPKELAEWRASENKRVSHCFISRRGDESKELTPLPNPQRLFPGLLLAEFGPQVNDLTRMGILTRPGTGAALSPSCLKASLRRGFGLGRRKQHCWPSTGLVLLVQADFQTDCL